MAEDLVRAAEAGQYEIVRQLLEKLKVGVFCIYLSIIFSL